METERPTGHDLKASRRAARLSKQAVATAMRVPVEVVGNLEYLGELRPDATACRRYLAAVKAIVADGIAARNEAASLRRQARRDGHGAP